MFDASLAYSLLPPLMTALYAAGLRILFSLISLRNLRAANRYLIFNRLK